MATTPYFLWPPQASSGSDIAGFGFGSPEETATEMALVAPELSEAVARPRLRRHTSGSGSGKQQQAGGGSKKPPQRGLGVAELERLRCGGDPLRDLNAVAAAAMGVDATNVQGNSVLLRHHHHDHHLPVFDAITSSRYYSPFLVQSSPPAPPAPPAPVCYVNSPSTGGQSVVAPEQQYFMDRWGRMGDFVPVASAVSRHQPQLPAPAPEHPSSQSTTWRPAASSASCLHTGHRCDLCSKPVRAFTERGSRTPAAAAAAAATTTTITTMPDYSIYDLAAAMASARKMQEKGEVFLAREGKKEVREIEFFPTSTNNAGGVGADESEFATIGWTAPFSSSSGGGCAPPLDLSLKL